MKSRCLLSLFISLLLLAYDPLTKAMTLEIQDNLVIATGPVDDDYRQFIEAFAKPGIDTVVFVNSPGGALITGLRVGRLTQSIEYLEWYALERFARVIGKVYDQNAAALVIAGET